MAAIFIAATLQSYKRGCVKRPEDGEVSRLRSPKLIARILAATLLIVGSQLHDLIFYRLFAVSAIVYLAAMVILQRLGFKKWDAQFHKLSDQSLIKLFGRWPFWLSAFLSSIYIAVMAALTVSLFR